MASGKHLEKEEANGQHGAQEKTRKKILSVEDVRSRWHSAVGYWETFKLARSDRSPCRIRCSWHGAYRDVLLLAGDAA